MDFLYPFFGDIIIYIFSFREIDSDNYYTIIPIFNSCI
jgi:hypothetical protein